jgi:ribonuclease III
MQAEILHNLENKINYRFKDLRLLELALTHKSYRLVAHKKKTDRTKDLDNERLEFLGDAVLELVVTNYLYHNYSDPEGYLTAFRSSIVNYKVIGEIGVDLNLEHTILISSAEKEELGKARLSIVADCMEAIIGAIYLDGGYESSELFVKKFIIVKLSDIIAKETYRDDKTKFQELAQKELKITPKYQVISMEGKDHQRIFQCVAVLDKKILGVGEGRSKQEAETQAASTALKILEKEIKLKRVKKKILE